MKTKCKSSNHRNLKGQNQVVETLGIDSNSDLDHWCFAKRAHCDLNWYFLELILWFWSVIDEAVHDRQWLLEQKEEPKCWYFQKWSKWIDLNEMIEIETIDSDANMNEMDIVTPSLSHSQSLWTICSLSQWRRRSSNRRMCDRTTTTSEVEQESRPDMEDVHIGDY